MCNSCVRLLTETSARRTSLTKRLDIAKEALAEAEWWLTKDVLTLDSRIEHAVDIIRAATK